MTTSKPNYIILDTDYYTYSMVYSCYLGKEYFWLLSRESTMDNDTYNKLLTDAKLLIPMFDFNELIP